MSTLLFPSDRGQLLHGQYGTAIEIDDAIDSLNDDDYQYQHEANVSRRIKTERQIERNKSNAARSE
jgi:hypothetical protein